MRKRTSKKKRTQKKPETQKLVVLVNSFEGGKWGWGLDATRFYINVIKEGIDASHPAVEMAESDKYGGSYKVEGDGVVGIIFCGEKAVLRGMGFVKECAEKFPDIRFNYEGDTTDFEAPMPVFPIEDMETFERVLGLVQQKQMNFVIDKFHDDEDAFDFTLDRTISNDQYYSGDGGSIYEVDGLIEEITYALNLDEKGNPIEDEE